MHFPARAPDQNPFRHEVQAVAQRPSIDRLSDKRHILWCGFYFDDRQPNVQKGLPNSGEEHNLPAFPRLKIHSRPLPA